MLNLKTLFPEVKKRESFKNAKKLTALGLNQKCPPIMLFNFI